ncbi:MAG: TraR/DksA family transcriptional regulator [Gammaproteobacteria bacterium]
MPTKDHYRQLLREKRMSLLATAQASGEAGQTVELDQTRQGRLSRMDALQSQAMAREAERRARAEVVRIDAALVRLEDDDFGYCHDCGDDIAPARLEVDPATILCVKCAERREG